jgi:hypothetical protein
LTNAGAGAYRSLAQVTAPNVTASSTFDPAGLRIARTVNGATTYTIRGAGGETLSEYRTSPCGGLVWARDVVSAGGWPLGAVKANPTTPSVTLLPVSPVSEAAGSVSLSVRITTPTGAATTCAVTVPYQTANGTATAGADYTTATGTKTFAAGTASGTTQAIAVPLINDTTDEPDETFTVTLTAAPGATLGTATQTVTVTDDDPGPLNMAIEAPAANGTYAQPVTLSGWAIDGAAPSGTGVDLIHVWAYPNPGSGQSPVFAGAATYGLPRSDIGQTYGAQFTNSGYSLSVRGLKPALYDLVVYARSTVTGTFNQSRVRRMTLNANPRMNVEAPAWGATVSQPFHLGGWAIDLAAASGTGVNTIHVWAYPNPGSGQAPLWVGVPTYGGPRPDVADAFGSAQFTNSGFGMSVTGLPAGTYQLVVYAYSTVSQSFNQAQSVVVTVQ